jgi:hypothetical protein
MLTNANKKTTTLSVNPKFDDTFHNALNAIIPVPTRALFWRPKANLLPSFCRVLDAWPASQFSSLAPNVGSAYGRRTVDSGISFCTFFGEIKKAVHCTTFIFCKQ